MRQQHGFAAVFAVLVILAGPGAWAEEAQEAKRDITVTMGGVSVNGDDNDFAAHRWMSNNGWIGIKNLSIEDMVDEDLQVIFESHAIPSEADIGAALKLIKADVGFLDMEYEMFRKYYDTTGGVYAPFTTLETVESWKDMELDIGEFRLEVGTPEDEPKGLAAYYEHHFKDGTKSRLTWSGAREGATTRKIAPTWQDVDEKTDVFGLKERTEIKGFQVKGEQRLELVKVDNLRQEQDVSTTATASDKKIRRQHQEIETTVFSTKFHGDKWFNDDNSYFSAGYRYQLVDSEELENLNEFDQFGSPVAYSNPKNKPGATSDADYDSHTLTSSYMNSLTDNLNFIIKVKGEILDKEGDSLYPNDTTSPIPDGIANNIESNSMENRVNRFGESISLRYSGLPKTNAYLEYDAEQTRNWLWESLVSLPGSGAADPSSNFERTTRTNILKNTVTLGSRTVPVKWFNATAQVRHRWDKNDYDDRFETSGGGGARSAFVEMLSLSGPEFETKLTWKPKTWLQSALRYQLSRIEYATRTDAFSTEVESNVDSDTLTYDVFLQPGSDFLVNLSYSTQNLRTLTPASSAASSRIPNFKSDVDSYLASLSWTPKTNLTYIASFNYAEAGNFDDFSAIGLPYGSDFDMYDITVGFDVQPKRKPEMTIKPRYGYYEYNPDERVEEGEYAAHVVWVDVSYKW